MIVRRGGPRRQAPALNSLGVVQRETGDYPAAAASQRQALALFRDQGGQLGEAEVLNDLGVLQQETGDFPAAAASHQRALVLFRDLGDHLDQAQALNGLGELAARTSATDQAREHHTQALAIVRGLGAPREEGRTLEGLGRACLLDGNPGEAAGHLTQALRIYQRIGDPAEQRVQQTLQKHGMTSATSESSPAAPESEVHQSRACRTTTEPLDGGRLTMGVPHQSGGTASSARYRSAGAEGTTKVHFGTAQLVQLHQGACGVNQGDSPVGPSDDDVLVDAARPGSASDFGSPRSDPIAGSRC